MISQLLKIAAIYLLPLLLLFSVFLLLTGHDEPGGGFVGGLTAASGYALYTFVFGVKNVRKRMPYSGSNLILTGLFIILLSGCLGLIVNGNFLQAVWFETAFPLFQKIGTPSIFDLGVYLLVIGAASLIVLTLAKE